jgi:S-DNA-T family DNA segregation ATPase FtsK/SpoIIIE
MARKAEKSKSPKGEGRPGWRFLRYCLVFILIGGVLLAWPSMLTFSPTDPPSPYVAPAKHPVDNKVGIVGAYVAYTLRYWLGLGAYALLFCATVPAVVLMFGGRIRDLFWRLIGVALLIVATSSAAYVLNPAHQQDLASGSVGVVGLAAGRFVLDNFAKVGACIIVALTLCVGLVLAADSLVMTLPRIGRKIWAQRGNVASAVGGGGHLVGKALAAGMRTAAAVVGPRATPAPAGAGAGSPLRSPAGAPKGATRKNPSGAGSKAGAAGGPGDAGRWAAAPPAAPKPAAKASQETQTPAPAAPARNADRLTTPAPVVPPLPSPSVAPAPAKLSPPTPPPTTSPRTSEPLRKAPPPVPAKSADASKGSYVLPSTDLLAEPSDNVAEAQEVQARHNQGILQQTFRDFNVEAQVVGYQTGPVITLFELALAPGVKVAQISNLATDIARALAVPGVRVVPPRFGKDTIGVEIPNLDKELVRIKELMALAPAAEKELRLPLYLGKDAGGNPIVADLAGMPHCLIAGTTGSGKSVCINSIIMSILMTRSPEDVRLILVDPKMVEMAAFENIPHLPCPIVHDMHKAEEILEWAATKMDERYEFLKEANVKNIASFNRLSRDEIYKRFEVTTPEEKAQIPTKMPYYVIIIDELADLIMTSDKEVETHIIRIAQKARAVGIHLILATQRPSVNVVTGLIKSNMPCRISFRVASRQESRIVLDQNGAEVLLGRGDMLFLEPGNSTLIRGQGALVEDAEIKTVVSRLREKGGPQYDAELMRLDSKPEGGTGEKDELFDQGVEIVLASQRGSVSLLQRRLQVGYSRASRIIDQMADAGILGDYKGSQARECLMTVDQWQEFKKTISADKSGANSANGEGTSV